MKSPLFVLLLAAAMAFSGAAHAAPPQTMDGATYAVRLRNIAARAEEAQERTHRNRLRLLLLSDSTPSSGSALAEISFHNEVTSDFLLVRAIVELDGTIRYDKSDDSGTTLANEKSIPVFKGSVDAGDHQIQILLTYRANGFGVFTYMRGYRVEVKSGHGFTANAAHPVSVVVTGTQTGGATTPIGDRIAIRWHIDAGPPPPTQAVRPAVATTAHVDTTDADPSVLAELVTLLGPYGTWLDDAAYGRVWVPSPSVVGPSFVPYVTGGHWTYEGVAGVGGDFAWVSDWSWGWAPFHLGRWVKSGAGWAWIPGRAYSTSWVVWRVDQQTQGKHVVGWAPSPPTYEWRNGQAAPLQTPPAPSFVYVPSDDLFATNLATHVMTAGGLEERTRVVDQTPSPSAMGVTTAVVSTPLGDPSLAHARDFATHPHVEATATATPTPSIDAADADPSVLGDVHDTLAPYGTWSDDATYGTVWTPSAPDFVPYETSGHWTFDDPDYTWISDYPWGWMPFHYGRWVRIGTRWSWIPGRKFQNAWVTWTTDSTGNVGWSPTPPTYVWKAGSAVALAPPPLVFVYVRPADLFAVNLSVKLLGGDHTPGAIAVRGPPPATMGIPTAVVRTTPADDAGLVRARRGLRVVLAPPPPPRVRVEVPQLPQIPQVNVRRTQQRQPVRRNRSR